jgi:hypothetical protein
MPAAPETESSESSVLASVYSVTVEPSFSLCLGACVYVGQCCRYFLCVRVCVCVDSSICVHVCADTTHRQLQANSEKFPTVANAQHLANAHAHTHTHTHAHTQPYAELSEYERSIEERVNAIVAAFDINNDGVISYEEFLMAMTGNADLIHAHTQTNTQTNTQSGNTQSVTGNNNGNGSVRTHSKKDSKDSNNSNSAHTNTVNNNNNNNNNNGNNNNGNNLVIGVVRANSVHTPRSIVSVTSNKSVSVSTPRGGTMNTQTTTNHTQQTHVYTDAQATNTNKIGNVLAGSAHSTPRSHTSNNNADTHSTANKSSKQTLTAATNSSAAMLLQRQASKSNKQTTPAQAQADNSPRANTQHTQIAPTQQMEQAHTQQPSVQQQQQQPQPNVASMAKSSSNRVLAIIRANSKNMNNTSTNTNTTPSDTQQTNASASADTNTHAIVNNALASASGKSTLIWSKGVLIHTNSKQAINVNSSSTSSASTHGNNASTHTNTQDVSEVTEFGSGAGAGAGVGVSALFRRSSKHYIQVTTTTGDPSSQQQQTGDTVQLVDVTHDDRAHTQTLAAQQSTVPFPDAETQHTLMYRSQRTPPPASAQTQPQSIKASQPSARTTATTITTVSRMNLSQLELHEVSKLFSLLCFACVSLCAFTCVCASGV